METTSLLLSTVMSKNKFLPVWTFLVSRESIHCTLRIECGEIWPWEIYSITVTFTALCAHGCLVLNYAAGNVIWPQHRQEANYHGLIFSKPKKERKKIHKGQVNLWICLSIRVEYVLDSTCLWVHITASFPLCFCAYVPVCVCVWIICV